MKDDDIRTRDAADATPAHGEFAPSAIEPIARAVDAPGRAPSADVDSAR